MRFTVIIEGDRDGGFSAYVPDLEGVVATGPTEAITRARIASGIEFHAAKLRAAGQTVPPARSKAIRLEIAV